MLTQRSSPLAAVLLVAIAAFGPPAVAEAPAPLEARIAALAREHGFTVRGLEELGEEPAPPATGTLVERLGVLLAGYDHVLDAPAGAVRRVIVLGRKRSQPPALVVETLRIHGHHAVTARLEGALGKAVQADLIVDSGASSIVLPGSLIEPLGFEASTLDARRSQTANGMMTGLAARLAEVRVGGAVASDVDVLFVPDERLGGVSLLGMSFLRGYAFTLDDGSSRLVLTPR